MSRRDRIKNGIILVMILVLYAVGVYQYKDMRRNYRTVTVRLQDQPITKEKIRTIVEEEQEKEKVLNITAYGKEEHVAVSNDGLGKNRQVSLYKVCGIMEHILPSELLCGNYVYQEDYTGCIIDKDTAYKLFGSYDIIGQSIKVAVRILEGELSSIQYKNFYIRGILSVSQPTIMIQAKEEETQFYSLQLDYGNSSRGREYAEQVLMIYQVATEYDIVDQNLIVRLTGNLLLLPWIILTFITVSRTFKKWNEIFHNQRQEWLHRIKNERSILLTLLCVIMLCIMVSNFGFFPLQYIPTKWSDFNSVNHTVTLIRQHIKEFDYITPSMREIALRGKVETIVIVTGGILVLLWVLYERKMVKKNLEG